MSSRSLGSSSDRVVGWQAGTTGRLELPSEVDEVRRARVEAEPSVTEPGPLPDPLPGPLGSATAAEAKRKAPSPSTTPPAAAGDVASKRRRKLDPHAASLRCSAGLCAALAELEGGCATRHPRLHVPLCLGHRSVFVRRGKQGWPMDGEGLHDCCQWCCGKLFGDPQLVGDAGGDRREVVGDAGGDAGGDRARQQRSEGVETLLCDGCDTAWCTGCLDPSPSPTPNPIPSPNQVHRLPRR